MYSITLHTKLNALIHKLSSSGQLDGRLNRADGGTAKTPFLKETRRKKKSRESKIKVVRLYGELSEIDRCQEMEICLHLNGLSF